MIVDGKENTEEDGPLVGGHACGHEAVKVAVGVITGKEKACAEAIVVGSEPVDEDLESIKPAELEKGVGGKVAGNSSERVTAKENAVEDVDTVERLEDEEGEGLDKE